jgi:hypothetical protein
VISELWGLPNSTRLSSPANEVRMKFTLILPLLLAASAIPIARAQSRGMFIATDNITAARFGRRCFKGLHRPGNMQGHRSKTSLLSPLGNWAVAWITPGWSCLQQIKSSDRRGRARVGPNCLLHTV